MLDDSFHYMGYWFGGWIRYRQRAVDIVVTMEREADVVIVVANATEEVVIAATRVSSGNSMCRS